MLVVPVYRVDYGRKIKDPIGTVFEKRKTERSNNYLDLLWLARRLFALDSADALHIVIDVRRAREGCLTELTREYSATASFTKPATARRPGEEHQQADVAHKGDRS